MSENPAETAGESGADRDTAENEYYHDYSVDDETQPQSSGDALVDDRGLQEPLDEGYSPPEKWSVAEGYGNTPLEEELGESLDQRLEQEVAEPDPYEQAAQDPDNVSGEVGDARSGRLVAEDQGLATDREKDLVADDVGVDGAGASAEEAAVHTVDEELE